MGFVYYVQMSESALKIQKTWRFYRERKMKKDLTTQSLAALSDSYFSLLNAPNENNSSPNVEEKTFMTLLNSPGTFELSRNLVYVVMVQNLQVH